MLEEERVDLICPPLRERMRVTNLLTKFGTISPFMYGYILSRATTALERVSESMKRGGVQAAEELLSKRGLVNDHVREGFILAGMIMHYQDWVGVDALPESPVLQQAQLQLATYSEPLFSSLDQAQIAYLRNRLVGPLEAEQSVTQDMRVRRSMLH